MINKPFNDIAKEDLEVLVYNSVIESKTIEYKLRLPGNSNGDKKEFLADVSSFANAIGGDIIFGVREKTENGKNTGEPEEIVGLSNINVDEEKRRIESIVRDGLEPRINGLLIEGFEGFTDGPVIIVRIPNSWLSPHMITFKGSQRFYSRNNAGKYPLDVTEIKTAFELSVGVSEKVRHFRDRQLSKLIADDTPLKLLDNPKIVLHLMPIRSLDSLYKVDLQEFNRHVNSFGPIYADDLSHRFNFDGILTYTNAGAPPFMTYTQIFRNGTIEAVNAFLLREQEGSEKLIPYITFGDKIFESLAIYINGFRTLGIELPVFVMLTLLNVNGYRMPMQGWRDRVPAPSLIDKDVLLLPDAIIEDYDIPPDVILRPAFDTLWQSANFAFCPHYNKEGRWSPKPN